MPTDILVSIIIPVYNSEKYIQDCLVSSLEQSYSKLEIVVVNDGSTDNSLPIMQKIARSDSRIRIIDKKNAGLVEARKTGALYALSDYIVFLDSDDLLASNAIELMVDNLVINDSDIVLSNFSVVLENGKKLFDSENRYTYGLQHKEMVANILAKHTAPTIWGKLMKKSLFLRTDTPSDITIGEDVVTMLQIYSSPVKVSCIVDNVYCYIQRPASMVNLKNALIVRKRLLYLNWGIYFIERTFSKDRTILQCLNIFIIYEYFCLLKDGGKPSDFHSIHLRVTNLFRTDRHAFNSLGKVRILLVWLFLKDSPLAPLFRRFYVLMRRFIYLIK